MESEAKILHEDAPAMQTGNAVELLAELQAELEKILDPFRQEFQAFLSALDGKTWESFEEKRTIALAIRDIAQKLQVMFRCPECELPARLQCYMAGNSKTGVFAFAHTRTTHRGTTYMPHLELLPKAPDRRREEKKHRAG